MVILLEPQGSSLGESRPIQLTRRAAGTSYTRKHSITLNNSSVRAFLYPAPPSAASLD